MDIAALVLLPLCGSCRSFGGPEPSGYVIALAAWCTPVVFGHLRRRTNVTVGPSTRCIHCAYDMAGLGARSACPECGECDAARSESRCSELNPAPSRWRFTLLASAIVLAAASTGWSQWLWRWFHWLDTGQWRGEHLWPPQHAAVWIGIVTIPWLALLIRACRARGAVLTAAAAGIGFWLGAPLGLHGAWTQDRVYPDGYAPAVFMLAGLLAGFIIGRILCRALAMLKLRRIRSSRAERSSV